MVDDVTKFQSILMNLVSSRIFILIANYVIYTLVQINLNTCKKESIFESFRFILKITKVQAVSEIINS